MFPNVFWLPEEGFLAASFNSPEATLPSLTSIIPKRRQGVPAVTGQVPWPGRILRPLPSRLSIAEGSAPGFGYRSQLPL